MAQVGKIARRSFLVGSVAILGGTAFGAWLVARPADNPLRPPAGGAALTPFVLITADGVTLITPRAEMGQGTQTTLAALLAEELDLDWQDIRIDHGPAARAYFNAALLAEALPTRGYNTGDTLHALGEYMGQFGKVLDAQVTGGSTAMKDAFEKYRLAGATAREALKAAAAQRWGLKPAQLRTESGHVIAPDGTRLPYSALAAEAAQQPLHTPALRPASAWRYLGKAMPRLDMVAKCTGTAQYGIDIRPKGLRFAALKTNPNRGIMRSYDASAALAMPGVEHVIDLGQGVAVVASSTWAAMQALDHIHCDWAPAPYPPNSADIMAEIAKAFDQPANSTLRDDGDAAQLPSGATQISAEYQLPYLAHATIEPMNATALYTGQSLTVWAGNQAPMFTKKACAAEAGLPPQAVDIITPYLGGGFGRRGELDFSVFATRLAKALPGTPVQLTWPRAQDMRNDFYRPAAIARMTGAVAGGRAVQLDAQVAAQSTSQQGLKRWLGLTPAGPDKGHVDGLFNAPYAIANHRVRGYLAPLDVPVGFWRSVGASFNAFFQECFIDELAHAAGRDPLEFRIDMMQAEFPEGAQVLQALHQHSNWASPLPPGQARGVAFCYSFGSAVAQVVELRQDQAGIAITRVTIVADLGLVLDPQIARNQLIGGCLQGLSAAMGEEITFAGGAAQQENFDSYILMRHAAAPDVEVHLLENLPRLGGVGEPGLPPAAPALANALFALTGQRLRQLPLSKHVAFAGT